MINITWFKKMLKSPIPTSYFQKITPCLSSWSFRPTPWARTPRSSGNGGRPPPPSWGSRQKHQKKRSQMTRRVLFWPFFLLFALFYHILSRSFFAFQLQARIVCVSDTHSMTSHMGRSVPDGDILIHAGDFTRCGHLAEVRNKKINFGNQSVLNNATSLTNNFGNFIRFDSSTNGWAPCHTPTRLS